VDATFLMQEQRLKESNSLVTSTEPNWETIRQQLTSAPGHDLDETAWQALSALSPEIAQSSPGGWKTFVLKCLFGGRSTFGLSVRSRQISLTLAPCVVIPCQQLGVSAAIPAPLLLSWCSVSPFSLPG
jgi:hypothetical protein